MKKTLLNGQWKLHFFEQTDYLASLNNLSSEKVHTINCTVPGNVDLDLSKTGYLPMDLFLGTNILKTEDYEGYEWWYETDFDAPDNSDNLFIRFAGVDCLSEYFINGEKIGESDNMYIPYEFNISNKVKNGKTNKLLVRLRSVVLEGYKYDYDQYNISSIWFDKYESKHIRKAPHSFEWDIMPRALSSGIWRDVELIEKSDYELKQLYWLMGEMSENKANISIGYEIDTKKYIGRNWRISIDGKCGNSTFHAVKKIGFKVGCVGITIENPKLWWPYGYGEAELYETTVKFYDGDILMIEDCMNIGLRTVELSKTDTTDGENGDFAFIINSVRIMCKGTNWSPLDVFHSRDKDRYEPVMNMVKDLGCNMLRCWGGNVYEQEYFYDFCDKNGIMVWQDFAMSCYVYPQYEDFFNKIREEAQSIIRQFRNHSSLVLWCGDNECDMVLSGYGIDPNTNKITREILPDVLLKNDYSRPYIPSSPHIPSEIFKSKKNDMLPEEHLWCTREYSKALNCANSKAHFVSEGGLAACPCRKSLEKFIESEHLWPYENDEQWIYRSSNMYGNPWIITMTVDGMRNIFGFIPDNLDDFIIMSQIVQAEGLKYFIERIRVKKPTTGGVLWWNLIDGIPQIENAVIDYYLEKKLAYYYIKHSQQPFFMMIDELKQGHLRNFVAINDTLMTVDFSYRIYDVDTDETLAEGVSSIGENQIIILTSLELHYSASRMLMIEWNANGEKGYNHYFTGLPAWSFEQYKKWLKLLTEMEYFK